MSGSRMNRQLGDKHLAGDELRAYEEERALNMASKSKIYGQDDLEDEDRSAGPRLYYTEIIRRIRKINSEIKVVGGKQGSVALYRPKNRWEYDESERDPERQAWAWDYVYVCGLEIDWLPEYSHVLLDSSHLPTREIHGWRSAIIALVKSGAICVREERIVNAPIQRNGMEWEESVKKTGGIVGVIRPGALPYSKAIKEFGDPSSDQRSGRWLEQLRPHMNH